MSDTGKRTVTEQRNLRRLQRVVRSLEKHKILPEDATVLRDALDRIQAAIDRGVTVQQNAERLHAEWEATHGPDLEHLH